MKVAIITSGFLPVPASKGGAVENLVMNLIRKNEERKEIDFTIFSVFDKDAQGESLKFNCSTFEFIKISKLISIMDKFIFFVAKKILKKENSQSYRYILQRLQYLNKCSKLLKQYDYDKVILENHPTQYFALKWRKNHLKYENRYYYHCHNEFPNTYKCDDLIGKTKKIICVSEFIAKNVANYLEMPPEKFAVLKNGIDETKFGKVLNESEKEELKLKYCIQENEKVLIFTGRITKEKGVKELIESLSNIKYTNYKLLVVGASLFGLGVKTKYQEDVENLIKGLNGRVIFTGFVDYEEISKLYQIADVAVLPSIWNDPAPLTVIESLMSGLPIITTKSGGIPEYAKNGSAIILDINNKLTLNLSHAIDELLLDDIKRNTMKESAIMVSKELTIENFYNNFYQIICDY